MVRSDFVVTDGAKLTFKGMVDWRMNDVADTQYVSYRKYCPWRLFAVRNGAVLNAPSAGSFNVKSPRTRFEVTDATVNCTVKDLWFGTEAYSTNFTFVLDGAEWHGGSGTMTLGTSAAATPLEFTITNSALTGLGGPFVIKNSVGMIADSTISTPNSKILRFSKGTEATVTGGSLNGFALEVGYGEKTDVEAGSTLTIAGGDHEFYNVYVGRDYGADGATNVLRQTGGSIRLTGASGYAYCDVSASFSTSDPLAYSSARIQLDGGTFTCLQLKGSNGAACAGGNGYAELSADGGRVCTWNPNSEFLKRFDRAILGPKGLTVDTTLGNANVIQDFTDKPGEKGLFVKDGSGEMTFHVTAYSVATTRVERGTLQLFAASADAFDTALEVRPGATFSLAGDTEAVSLAGLAVDNGKILLDPDDRITVDGPVSFRNLELAFTSAPELDDAFDWLVVRGELSDETMDELKRAFLSNTLADGIHPEVKFDFDGTETTVTVSIAKDLDPIGAEGTTEWQGATGAWETDGSWTKGVPDAAKKAAFTGAGATDVTVPEGAVAGAVQFDADGYRLSGGDLAIDAEQGAAQIVATAGENEIASPLRFHNIVAAPVEAGAKVTLSGTITGGGVRKSGTGELVLGAANGFQAALTVDGGRLTATAGDALSARHVALITGTLAVDGDCSEVPPLAIRAPAINDCVILDVRTNATVGSFATESGAIVKRGVGTMTLDMTTGNSYTLACMSSGACTGSNNGGGAYTENFTFPEDGSALTGGYGGFTIAEGEIAVRNDPASSQQLRAGGSVIIGMPLAVCAKQPSLVIDGAYFNARENMPASTHFFNGVYLGYGNNAVMTSSVTLINGATLYADTYRAGMGTCTAGAVASTAITNSTLRGGYATYFANTYNDAISIYRCKDAQLLTGAASIDSAQFCGTIDMDAENTVLANTSGGLCRAAVNSQSGGRVYFHDGGLFYVSVINATSIYKVNKDITFAFNDTEWRGAASGSYTLQKAEATEGNYNGHVLFEMVGKGVIFDPKTGNTVTVDLPFSGTGGLQVKSGTVAFAADSYGFTGPCAVSESAVADLTNAGVIDTAAFAGQGTVRNATVRRARIVQDAADDWTGGVAPTFDGSKVTGRLTVDFGRTEANPLSETLPQGLVIAKLVNGSTLASKSVKLLNTGREHVVGIARVTEDGDVVMDVINAGLMMIVR